jgi:hypothetical protein
LRPGRPKHPSDDPSGSRSSPGDPAPPSAWLGVAIAPPAGDLDEAAEGPKVAVVRYVRHGSPADMAGVLPSDVVLSIGGVPAVDSLEPAGSCAVCKAGAMTELVVLRGVRKLTLHATPTARPSEEEGFLDSKVTFDDLAACVHGERCPRGDQAKARKSASEAFECPLHDVDASQVDIDRDPIEGSMHASSDMGEVDVVVTPNTQRVFEVHGCGHAGTMVCFRAHRTLRSGAESYDNARDQLCVRGNRATIGVVL